MRTKTFIAIAIVSALATVPARVQSQTATTPEQISKLAHALELEQRAKELHADPTRASEAARLHRQSAHLRSANDPEAVESLAMAAHLFSYAQRPLAARNTMEEAADRALAMGDVFRAARAYVEAAFLADKQQDRAETTRLGRKALLLAGSTRITAEERASIIKRIRTTSALASLEQ
jgi:hypothetical protein